MELSICMLESNGRNAMNQVKVDPQYMSIRWNKKYTLKLEIKSYYNTDTNFQQITGTRFIIRVTVADIR